MTVPSAEQTGVDDDDRSSPVCPPHRLNFDWFKARAVRRVFSHGLGTSTCTKPFKPAFASPIISRKAKNPIRGCRYRSHKVWFPTRTRTVKSTCLYAHYTLLRCGVLDISDFTDTSNVPTAQNAFYCYSPPCSQHY